MFLDYFITKVYQPDLKNFGVEKTLLHSESNF